MPPNILEKIYNGLLGSSPETKSPKIPEEDPDAGGDFEGLNSAIRALSCSLELHEYYAERDDGRVVHHQRKNSQSQEIQAALSPRSLSYSDVGPLSLEEFIVRLPAVVERCSTRQMAKCEPVKRLLGRLKLTKADWERYAFWDSSKLYTRNLVATDNRTFTLLLLCWNPGRESPIHDHPCEGCWVKTLAGEVVETVYEADGDKELKAVRETVFREGELSYIEDSMGFHKVANKSHAGSATLHCYIPPPKMCRIWMNPDRFSECHTVECSLFSAYGQRVTEGNIKSLLTQMQSGSKSPASGCGKAGSPAAGCASGN